MPKYERRERITTTVEYVVHADQPWGATWPAVHRAITDAVAEKRRLIAGGTENTVDVSEDDVRVLAGDDEIIVRFVAKDITP